MLTLLEDADKETDLYFHPFGEDTQLTDIYIGPLCQETEDSIKRVLQPEDLQIPIVKTRIAHKTFNVVQQDSKY